MDTIFFTRITLNSINNKITYFEEECTIEKNKEEGIVYVKEVKCWSGVYDLRLNEKEINKPWANEFPAGTIESKMWCDANILKQAKSILSKEMGGFLKTFTPFEVKPVNKLNLLNTWNLNKENI